MSLVEGSITTAADERRIKGIPEQSKVLVTIGACATASGVQALRNFADVEELASVVYARARIHRHVGDVHSGEYISQLGRNVARHIRTIMSKESHA